MLVVQTNAESVKILAVRGLMASTSLFENIRVISLFPN